MSSFGVREPVGRVRPWGGTVLVSLGHALYVGRAGDTRPHRHHALQLVVAERGSFEASFGAGEPRQSFEGLLIGSDVEHRIDGGGLGVAIYYVDGSSHEGRAMSQCLEGAASRRLDAQVAELRQGLETVVARPRALVLEGLRTRYAEILGYGAVAAHGDPAVESAIAILEGSLASPPAVPELAERLGLRQRDLSSRFRRETGLTIRRHVLWLRLKAAVSALGEGRTLTEAAWRAGFADAAHLTRTFVEMFGVSPSKSVAASGIDVFAPD